MRKITRDCRGVTLVEVLVATIILTVAGIPVLMLFTQSRQSIDRVDRRREVRYFAGEILAHASRQPLHELWEQFGPGDVVGWEIAGRMRHQIADFDPRSGKILERNPLGFTRGFLRELIDAGLEARLHFEFYSREELGIVPLVPTPGQIDRPSPEKGILHMQAGYACVELFETKLGRREKVGQWVEPIMCPAIVGRPGLKLSSCPAIRADVRAKFLPLLGQREGWAALAPEPPKKEEEDDDDD